MGTRFKFNLLPTLQPDEKVLFVKKWVGFCTCLSSPNYRCSFSLPPLLEQGLFITDKRVLHIAHCLRIFASEFDQWFNGNKELKDTELIKTAKVGRHWLCGPYLEIVSENTKKLWYRSRRARIRLYMRKAESACKIITETMVGNADINAK